MLFNTQPISWTSKALQVVLKAVSVLFLFFAATRAIADCGQRETEMPQDIEQRLAMASQFWEREYCFDISEIQLREIAEEARTQRRLRVEIAALLVLADMYAYDGRDQLLAAVTDRLRALVVSGVTQEEAVAITLAEVELLILHRHYREAQTRLTETIVHLEIGSFPVDLKARAYMSRALVHFRLGLKTYGAACQEDARTAINLLTNHPEHSSLLGQGYWHLGRCEESGPQRFPHFDIALKLCHESGDVRCQQRVLNGYAIYLRRAGRYQEAMTSYEASLDIARRYGYRAKVGLLLGNMAGLHRVMNHNSRALETIQEAIGITRALGSRYALSYRLDTLGDVQLEAGYPSAAVDAFRESMEIREQAGYTYEKVIPAFGLGKALLALGREEEAIAVLQKNKEEASNALNGLAFANTVIILGRIGRANAAELLMAADIARFLGVVEPEWDAMHLLAQQSAQQKNIEQSIFFGKQAVNLFQRVRALNSGMDRQAQRELLARGMAMYKDLAGWLIAQGRLSEAQQVMGMLKEDEYSNFVQHSQSADIKNTQASMTSSESAAQARIRESGNRLFRLAARVREIEGKRDAGGITEAERAELRSGREELRAANTAFEKMVRELRETITGLDNTDRRKELERKLIEQSLAETVRSLGANVAVIQTVTLPDHLALLLTTDKLSRAYRVSIDEADLERQVDALRNALRRPQADPLPAARAVYEILLGPLRADLQESGITMLMFSLDGTLRYVPIAALHDGTGYLVETYATSVFNEAARTSVGLPPAPRWRVAGLGLSKEMAGFTRLPAVVDELQAIAGVKGVLPGYVYLNEQFDRNTLLDAVDDGLPVIHIASHFKFQPGTEADSFLLLGNGDKLTLGEFREQIRLTGVDLLSLSACETAVGGKGSEIEGLAVTAQLRGAKSVLATLWPVADASTAHLMQSFYRLREEKKLTKAEALRQAQQALLSGKVGAGGTAKTNRIRTADGKQAVAFVPDPDAPFAHPYYWAPFILMGNWL